MCLALSCNDGSLLVPGKCRQQPCVRIAAAEQAEKALAHEALQQEQLRSLDPGLYVHHPLPGGSHKGAPDTHDTLTHSEAQTFDPISLLFFDVRCLRSQQGVPSVCGQCPS